MAKRKINVVIINNEPFNSYHNFIEFCLGKKYNLNIKSISGYNEDQMLHEFSHSLHIEKKIPLLIVFTGGEDVNPALYGDIIHYTTSTNVRRDNVESSIFRSTVNKSQVAFLGICRGLN